ncbi:DUF1542 domain-containing protein [Streptococcus suis]|nr:DUF1542 domain-containing protein [Streptococcus suis]
MNRSKKKSFDWYGVRQRFSIRKYHIGAASVLLGTTLVLGTGTIVSAETGVNGDGDSNGQIVPVNNDGISDGTQPQGDNQGNNSSGVQTGNTTNSTANVQPANDTGSESGQPVVNPRTMALTPEGDGLTNQPVADPIMIIPSSASETAPQGYVTVTFEGNQYTRGFALGNQTGSLVKVFVKNDVTWGTLLDDPAWQWPTVKTDPGDTVVGWAVNISYNGTYNPNNAFARDKYKDTVVTNTKLYPNVVYEVEDVNYATKEQYLALYGSDDRDKWIIITFDAGQGQLNGSKTSKMVAVSNNLYPIEFSNNKFREKVESPTLQGHTFVRWQTDAGDVLPKSGPITTETTYKALYLAHPQNKVAVFDSTKLTDSEKEQVKKNILDANPDLSTGVAPAIKAIDISDTGEATVTFDDGTVVKVSSTTLTNEDKDTAKSNAKAEIEKEATEKSDAINASNLTEEEKTAKLEEVNNAKAAADSAIDQANTSDELNQALTNGQSAISGIDTSTSAKKEQAKQELKAAADDAKKAIDANNNLTPEEKDVAKKAVDDEVANAEKAIDAATKADEVDAATLAGEKAIAKQDLETAYNAKKNEIANSALTAKEKAAKQAELDQAKSAADSAIDAATDYAGVTQALKDGKKAIAGINTSTSAGINTSTSAKKAQAKQDLETAYNAKKAEIDNSALTAGEKVAKQAELDKAKADADKAINAATDNAGVAKALEDGKKAIAGIDTSTSAKKAQAKQDLEAAYNAKKEEIANSALTAEEKAAKQAELDKAKADADKAIDAATDDAGVAKALEDGKAAIDAINTSTSAGIDTSTSAGIDTSTSAMKAGKKNTVLPKTGDNVGLSNILGVAGLALLGTAIRKKRED